MKNLFVGNMNYDTTESSLREMFERFGEVARVQIITDRESGRARGFAFVEMPNDAEAERAIAELNGSQLDGRTLNINEARPRPEKQFGGGGGGGGRRPGGGGGGGRGRGDRPGGGRGGRREPRW